MYKLSEITLQENINELEDAGDPHTFLPAVVPRVSGI